jgi:hypothetical protein
MATVWIGSHSAIKRLLVLFKAVISALAGLALDHWGD